METPQPIKPQYVEPGAGENPVPRLENLTGLFRTQDDIPTVPARKLDEQIRIAGGVPYLYDTVSGDWIPIGSTGVTYAGRVDSDGSANTPMPAGWTTAKTATGIYVVTHNLGSAAYGVTFAVISGLFITIANLAVIGANSFEVRFYNHITGDTWSAANTPFSFILAQG